MEREWSGNARRLSQADRAEIERLIWSGETFETAAAAVGCSTKSIQRFLALTGGLKRRVKQRSAAASVACGARGALARPGRRRLSAGDRDATGESAFDDLARGRLERIPQRLSRVASRPRSDRARPPTQAGEAGRRLAAVPRSRAWPARRIGLHSRSPPG